MSNLERVSLTLPKNLWEQVKQIAPPGQRSRLVVEAIEAEIRRRKRMESLENLHEFQQYMHQRYGKLPASADDIRRMRQERENEIPGLR